MIATFCSRASKNKKKRKKNGMLDAPRCKTLLSVAANDLRARKTL